MAQRCTLGAWTTNSQVVTAVSDTPTGPYVRQAIAIPPWSHNPEAIHTPDGKFVIFTLGPGKGKTVEKNCTRGDYVPDAADEAALVGEVSTRANLPPAARAPGPVNFTVHSADSPHGPWVAATMAVHVQGGLGVSAEAAATAYLVRARGWAVAGGDPAATAKYIATIVAEREGRS